MTQKHVKFINVLKLFIWFVSMFINNNKLFKPFHKLKIDLKKNHIFWKDANLNEKYRIEFLYKNMYIISIIIIIMIMNGIIYNQN